MVLVDNEAIEQLDRQVLTALDTLDYSPLRILGNGELTVVLGCPADAPEFVAKPMGPFTAPQADQFMGVVADYMHELRQRGVKVVDTELVRLDRSDGQAMVYMIQSVIAAEHLAENVLGDLTPDAEHPLLICLGGSLAAMDDRLGIDAPISNWRWQHGELALLDVGLPMMFDAQGASRFQAAPFANAFPWVMRALAVKEVDALVARYRDPRVAAVEFVSRLPFFGLAHWQAASAERLNKDLALSRPITIHEADELAAGDTKTIPMLKRAQRVERSFRRTVRRARYDYFISTSTY